MSPVDVNEAALAAMGVHIGARWRAQRRRLAERLAEASVELTGVTVADLLAEAERRDTRNVAVWLADTLADVEAMPTFLAQLRARQARLDAQARPQAAGDSWANQPAYASFEEYQRKQAAAQGITVEQLERERDEAIAAAERRPSCIGAAKRFANGRVPHPPRRRATDPRKLSDDIGPVFGEDAKP